MATILLVNTRGEKMNKPGRDALAETHDVLNGLRHFLSEVEKAAHSDTNAELKTIEKSLAAVAQQIAAITQVETPSSTTAEPFCEPL